MAALAIGSRSANENCYRSLRAEFDCAYKEMMDSSREFTAVLMNARAELSPEERRARKDKAAQAMGKKGGAARARNLTAEQRQEIAQKAAKARWRSQE